MATDASPPSTAARAAAQLQFVHLEKIYGHLPGLTSALPAIFGVSSEEYVAIREEFDARALDAARELLTNDEVAARIATLPFGPGARVVAVGDSLTDDLQSWIEILRHVLALARPADDITVVNSGLSAHTTAMVLRRWPSMLDPTPDWVICALGTNDITRIADGKPQVSPSESVANLRELRRVAAERSKANWVWITPVPVHEERAKAHRPFHFGASGWRNSDVGVLTDEMLAVFEEPVVNLDDVFSASTLDELQGVDGVHPSLLGQQHIAEALIRRLSA